MLSSSFRSKQFILLFSLIICTSIVNAQLVSDSFLIDGHYRTFYFNKPQQSREGASLVFVLHGSGGTAQSTMKPAAALEERSQAENLILVYPQGFGNTWNECRKTATTPANVQNIDENTFFTQMIAYFKSRYSINESQVFAIGFSGGGHMAYKLAVTMPQQIKAITAIVASLPAVDNMDCSESKKPMAVMIVNGTADAVNPYNGGEVKAGNLVLGTVRSTKETFQYWAGLSGYKNKPQHDVLPDSNKADSISIERYRYKQPGRPEVVLLKVVNGNHEFPKDIDVFIEAWEFFKRQLKKG